MAPGVRLELTTLRLTAACSAIELLRNAVACSATNGIIYKGTRYVKGFLHKKATFEFQSLPWLRIQDFFTFEPKFNIMDIRYISIIF